MASVAGVKISKCEVDDDSVDITFQRSGGLAEAMDVQLKCTADPIPHNGDLSYPLKLKNYEDLSRITINPRILVVLFVPDSSDSWLDISEGKTILKHSAWWIDLRKADPTNNRTSVTVKLLRGNLFTPSVIHQILDEQKASFIQA